MTLQDINISSVNSPKNTNSRVESESAKNSIRDVVKELDK